MRLLSTAILSLLPLPGVCQTPAFPGAQGFGAHATGGRGGDVYTVTNLNSSGAGSLAEGIANAPSAGRTIVFAVSGYIHVPGSNLRIVKNKITIAGQTAPGDGIGLKDGTLRITGNNTVIRNLRIRHGKNGGGGDCLNVDSSATHSIIDHVSMQFSTDENISFFNSALDNFTMQESLSAWGLESHNAGGLWDLDRGTCHHSLWAHHHTRNPKARPYGLLEWINNVTFDWGIGMIMGDSQTPAPWKANVRGSYFLSPPGYTDSIALEKATVDRNGNPNFSLHLDDCLHDSDGDGILNGTDKGYAIVGGSEFSPGDPSGANRYIKSAAPFAGSGGNVEVAIDDPLTAFKKVISNAGAVRLDAAFAGPLRDEVDTVLFNNVVTQKHSRITRESELPVSNNGFGTLNSGTAPSDLDLDGMPDHWEQALGFNPAAADHNTVFAHNGSIVTADTFFPAATPAGFTRLEEYLHFLSVPHATLAKSTAELPSSITADLRKFTSGFSKSPTFSITGVKGGSIQQFAADGTTPSATGPIVRFTPATGAFGRAGFEFTVTDGDASSWTRQFAILVSNATIPRDLNWSGDGGSVWDTANERWQLANGSPAVFSDGDNVLFDDRGSSQTITISGTRNPTSMTITGTRAYSFSGGQLAGTGSLTKAGDTPLTLATTASFGAGTFLNGGNTILENGAVLGGGAIQFTGGSTLTSNFNSSTTLSLDPDLRVNAGAVGNIVLSQRANLNGSLSGSGTFNITSPSTLGTEGRVYLNGSSAGCTGTINLIGNGTGRIAFKRNGGSFNGFDNGRLHLSGIAVFTANGSGGNTYALGALSGDPSSALAGAYLGGATTWNIGGLGLDSTFAGSIRNGATGITHLIKSGSGMLTLSGGNTYTGTTTLSGGTLAGSGSLGSSALILQGTTLAPGDTPGEAGTFTVGNGLELNAATLRFDLSSNPAAGNDRILNQGGTLVFRSPGGNLGAHFDFNLTDGTLGEGTYPLITGGSGTSAPGSPAFTHNLPANSRQTFALQRSGGGSTDAHVRLVVTGTAGHLTWTGSTPGWDLGVSTPWSGGPSGDNFFHNLDNVDFTDSASNGTVVLNGTLQPRAVHVANASTAYTFGGSGSLAGITTLIKSGSGTLTLANSSANSFTGGTLLEAGTLDLQTTASPLGSGPITIRGGLLSLPATATFLSNPMVFSGTSAIRSAYGGNSTVVNSIASSFRSEGDATVDLSGVAGILSINGPMSGFSGTLDFGAGSGMLRLNSNSSPADDVNSGSASTHFALGTGGATLTNRNGDRTIDLGALSGGPGTHLNGRQSGSGNTATTCFVGALDLDTAFDGTLHHGGDLAGLHLVKTGSGTLSLGGSSDLTGSLDVRAGTLALPGSVRCTSGTSVRPGATLDLAGGSLASDSLQIEISATLAGSGSVSADLVNDGSILANGPLTLNGDVVNNGLIRLTSGASLNATGAFINNGVLDLLTAAGSLPANLENNGIVIDSSGLELTATSIGPVDVALTLRTYEGHLYQLQWSPDMDPDTWTDVGPPVAGDGSETDFTHPGGAAASGRFYRISVGP